MTATVHHLPDQVERKVASLRASEFSEQTLRRACELVLAGRLPLRDAIVLRAAKRIVAMLTPEVAATWRATQALIRASVPESTYRLWIEPLEAAGADEETLYLAAPEGIRAWTERRYSGLIAEALADADPALRRVSFAPSPISLTDAPEAV